MTRKHFQLIVDQLRRTKPESHWSDYAAMNRQWSFDVSAMMHVCKMANPNFSPDKFLAALSKEQIIAHKLKAA